MTSAPKSVFVTLGGGLGDVFYTYVKGQNGWGYLQSLKETYPNTKVLAMCSTHNPQTVEFIKLNPYIDEIKEFGWVLDATELWENNREDSIRLDKQKGFLKNLEQKKPKLYLEQEENDLIKSISSQGDFVLMHPFAGEPHRRVLPAEEYVPLIDKIIDHLKMNVVLIGGSYTRSNRIHKESKNEELEYEREGLFNLIGKGNSRICMTLAREQKYFIGSWSAYSCASWLYNKKTIVLLQENDRPKLRKKLQGGHRWAGAKCKMVVTKGPSHNPKGTDFNKVRTRAYALLKHDIK